MTDLFDPVEHAILCDYFGIPRPEALRDVDVLAERRSRRGVAAPVRVEPDTFGRLTGNSLGNAVARMLLAGTEPRLPPGERGTFGYAMGIWRRGAPYSQVNSKWLAFLFEVDWATNGPYFS